ncbi:hypothetical protein [Corynebacterium sp. 22KM0430]|uniref:hypothetical protein n=1 Tax=Corynebacterium sp. 22KM0430 TaxID=2989735 RepID=UPI0029C9B38B|nr:hypothetical protein [Corynebacterium sp. 22KM0430]WPF65357.1 hypothetical protein OLX12_07145 [Corynebacterium sp. 22KM0430]
MENRKESTILHMENRNIKGSKWATFLISILSPVAFFPFLFTKDITNGRYIWTRHGGIFGSGFDLGKVFYMEIPVATLATTISINLVIYFKASTGARGGLSQENVRKFFLSNI